MTKPTDREIHTYVAGTLYPGGMPPTEISLLMTAANLIAQREGQRIERRNAAIHILRAIEYLEMAEKEEGVTA